MWLAVPISDYFLSNSLSHCRRARERSTEKGASWAWTFGWGSVLTRLVFCSWFVGPFAIETVAGLLTDRSLEWRSVPPRTYSSFGQDCHKSCLVTFLLRCQITRSWFDDAMEAGFLMCVFKAILYGGASVDHHAVLVGGYRVGSISVIERAGFLCV